MNGSDSACCKGDFFILTVSGGHTLREPALHGAQPKSLSLAGRAAPHLADPRGPGKQKRAANSWDLLWIPLCLPGHKIQPQICCWDVLGRLLSRAFLAPERDGDRATGRGGRYIPEDFGASPPLCWESCTQARQAPPNLAPDTAFCVPGSALMTQGWQLSPAEPRGRRGSSCQQHTRSLSPAPDHGDIAHVASQPKSSPSLPSQTGLGRQQSNGG